MAKLELFGGKRPFPSSGLPWPISGILPADDPRPGGGGSPEESACPAAVSRQRSRGRVGRVCLVGQGGRQRRSGRVERACPGRCRTRIRSQWL